MYMTSNGKKIQMTNNPVQLKEDPPSKASSSSKNSLYTGIGIGVVVIFLICMGIYAYRKSKEIYHDQF